MRGFRTVSLLAAGWVAFSAIGCRITIPPPSFSGDGGDNGALPGGDGSSGDGSNDQVPVVSLEASSITPQLNETVVLQCSVTSGGGGAIRFEFQPDSGRLIVNTNTGRATFVVTDADIGVAFRFTCTAENEAGTSEPSREVVITASASP